MGCNVISLGERVTGIKMAIECVKAFLNEPENEEQSIVKRV